MNQNLNVSAKTFVQVINEGRQKQSDLYGKWFSSKETGEQLIRKAQQYLDAYRKYVEYLEKVVVLNPRDLDIELIFPNLIAYCRMLHQKLEKPFFPNTATNVLGYYFGGSLF